MLVCNVRNTCGGEGSDHESASSDRVSRDAAELLGARKRGCRRLVTRDGALAAEIVSLQLLDTEMATCLTQGNWSVYLELSLSSA